MKNTYAQKKWFYLVEDWMKSTLSQAEFCRQHDLSPKSFSRHRIDYLKHVNDKSLNTPSLIPVKVIKTAPSLKSKETGLDSKIEINLTNGILIRVDDKVNVDFISTLVMKMAKQC